MLKIMHEQSCDAGEDAEGAHEPQGQVAFVPCFGPVSPCYCRPAGPLQPAPGCARFLFSSRNLRGNAGARLCSVCCFSPVVYRERRLGCSPGAAARAACGGTQLVQLEPERVGLIGDLAASDRVDGRHHAAVAAEHAVGERDKARLLGVAVARGAAKLARDRQFVATRD